MIKCDNCQKFAWNNTDTGRTYFCIYDVEVTVNGTGKHQKIEHRANPFDLNKNKDCVYFKRAKYIKSTDQLSKKDKNGKG